MKFLVDAQLPYRLVDALAQLGHDSIHTLDLPDGNATSDHEVASATDRDDRVVVTKDVGFRVERETSSPAPCHDWQHHQLGNARLGV